MQSQFSPSELDIIPLKGGERYVCSKCSIPFVQKAECSHYDSGRLTVGNRPYVYCPMCASCYLRFYPSMVVEEELEPAAEPYSVVTRFEDGAFNYQGIQRLCLTAAVLSKYVLRAESVEMEISGKKVKGSFDEIVEYSKKIINSYRELSLNLAYSAFGSSALPVSSQSTFHNPMQHKLLGEAVFNANVFKGSVGPEQLKDIFLMPSIEQAMRYIGTIYSKDYILDMLDMKIETVEA